MDAPEQDAGVPRRIKVPSSDTAESSKCLSKYTKHGIIVFSFLSWLYIGLKEPGLNYWHAGRCTCLPRPAFV